MDINNLTTNHNFSDAEIDEIVAEKLPQWRKACDNSAAEAVMFHQDAFGHSTEELLLMGLAIKYAKKKGKQIRIVS